MKKIIYILIIFNLWNCDLQRNNRMKTIKSQNSKKSKNIKALNKQNISIHKNSSKKSSNSITFHKTKLEKIEENGTPISIIINNNKLKNLMKVSSNIRIKDLKYKYIFSESMPYENEDIIFQYGDIIMQDCFNISDYDIQDKVKIKFKIDPLKNMQTIKRSLNLFISIYCEQNIEKLEKEIKNEVNKIINDFKILINIEFKDIFSKKNFIKYCIYFEYINMFISTLTRFFDILEERTDNPYEIEFLYEHLYNKKTGLILELKLCIANMKPLTSNSNNILNLFSKKEKLKLDEEYLKSRIIKLNDIKKLLIKFKKSLETKLSNQKKYYYENYFYKNWIKIKDFKVKNEIFYGISKYIIFSTFLINEYNIIYPLLLNDYYIIIYIYTEINNIILDIKVLLKEFEKKQNNNYSIS